MKHKETSPFVLGITRLIPTFLIWFVLLVVIGNLLSLSESKNHVLGAETNLPYGRLVKYEDRIGELKAASSKLSSEKLQQEIDMLSIIP